MNWVSFHNHKRNLPLFALTIFPFLLLTCNNPLALLPTQESSTRVQVTLTWDPNTEPDRAGSKLYYGFASRSYQYSLDVGNQTTYTLINLEANRTYFIAVTAYNTAGLESDYSNEIVFK